MIAPTPPRYHFSNGLNRIPCFPQMMMARTIVAVPTTSSVFKMPERKSYFSAIVYVVRLSPVPKEKMIHIESVELISCFQIWYVYRIATINITEPTSNTLRSFTVAPSFLEFFQSCVKDKGHLEINRFYNICQGYVDISHSL